MSTLFLALYLILLFFEQVRFSAPVGGGIYSPPCCKSLASLPVNTALPDQNCSVFVISCRRYCFVPGNVYDEIKPKLLIPTCLNIFFKVAVIRQVHMLGSCDKK